MIYIELLILAISLCFDTLAVSLSGGLSLQHTGFARKAVIMAFFAFFQSSFLFFGWAAGALCADYIMQWDHWLAFVILAFIGGKMIFENLSFKGNDSAADDAVSNNEAGCKKSRINLLNYRTLVTLAVATSIDAIAVGISLAFIYLPVPEMLLAVVFTFAATAMASYIGLSGGEKIGERIGAKATLLGGFMLVLIGFKILLEHLLA